MLVTLDSLDPVDILSWQIDSFPTLIDTPLGPPKTTSPKDHSEKHANEHHTSHSRDHRHICGAIDVDAPVVVAVIRGVLSHA